ncbi:MAG: SUMF1/EgtB/PvdO family nonheme iron enzyme [Deltaproteobacteria bacterium]
MASVRGILLGEVAPEQVCIQERLSKAELTEWIRVHRRAARRAIDEQIAATLSAHGLEKEDFVLSGNLESMALSDLLEAIQFGRKNAHIRIEHDGKYNHLWCADGEVIDAQAGSLSGTRAVYKLLSLRQGRLQAEFSSVLRERTVLAPTEALLLEYARRHDEGRVLREQIGDMTRICLPIAGALSGPALEAGRADVLRKFDGTRSIAEVVEASERPELETLVSIAHLLAERRLIAISALGPDPISSPVSSSLAKTSEPPASAVPSSRLSVPPIAPSSAAQRPLPRLARRYAPFAVAALALPLAFAAGFWSVRPFAPESQQALAAPPPWAAKLAPALCGPEMAFLPGGAALSDSSLGAAEATLRPFCLAQRAVSTQAYQACVASRQCEPAQTESSVGQGAREDPQAARCNAQQPGRESYPINCVTYRQAEQYCQWRGQRLPLAAEWEFAWRSSRAARSVVSADLAGTAGLWSSFAEVAEWTKGGARPHSGAEQSADAPSYAVLAGGASEGSAASGARPSRLFMSASAHAKNLGFRCALSLAASGALPPTELPAQGTGGVNPQ